MSQHEFSGHLDKENRAQVQTGAWHIQPHLYVHPSDQQATDHECGKGKETPQSLDAVITHDVNDFEKNLLDESDARGENQEVGIAKAIW